MIPRFIIAVFFLLLTYQLPAQAEWNPWIQVPKLEKAAQKYSLIADSVWHQIPIDSIFKPGDSSVYIPQMRKNLQLIGELSVTDTTSLFFDENFRKTILAFQLRNGIKPTGVVARETIKAINVLPSVRLMQIKQAITYWRLFCEQNSDLQKEIYALMNIPAYELYVFKEDKINLVLKTVVGKTSTPTTEMRDTIEYIVFKPIWIIPYDIFKNEIIPLQKKNPGYLAENHIHIYKVVYNEKYEVDPDSLDWNKMEYNCYKYRIEQSSGSWNPLGEMKFIFPNKSDVYIHDTNERYLFERSYRAYSHGCIRVKDPVLLATFLFFQDTKSSHQKEVLNFSEAANENHFAKIPKPVPVLITYFTCWITDDNVLCFRNDIYNKYSFVGK